MGRVSDTLGAVPPLVWPVLWLVAIVVVSLLPQASPAARVLTLNGRDFLAHLIAYGVFGTLIFWSLGGCSLGVRSLAMIFLPLTLGTGIELLQPLVGRTCSWLDVCADGVGVVIALVAAMVWTAFR